MAVLGGWRSGATQTDPALTTHPLERSQTLFSLRRGGITA